MSLFLKHDATENVRLFWCCAALPKTVINNKCKIKVAHMLISFRSIFYIRKPLFSSHRNLYTILLIYFKVEDLQYV